MISSLPIYTPLLSFSPSLAHSLLCLSLDPHSEREGGMAEGGEKEMRAKKGFRDMGRKRDSQRMELFIGASKFLLVHLNHIVKALKSHFSHFQKQIFFYLLIYLFPQLKSK